MTMRTRFLECIDRHLREGHKRPNRASVNSETLSCLLDSIALKDLAPNLTPGGDCQIFGVKMEIDGQLPDYAIKLDRVIYLAENTN